MVIGIWFLLRTLLKERSAFSVKSGAVYCLSFLAFR